VEANSSSSLADVVATGDYRSSLLALRDRLALEVERVAEDGFCPQCKRGSSSVAPLSKQLADLLATIEALPTGEASHVDDLTTRRDRRRSHLAGGATAEGGGGTA
jgi:hypothetical protein